jgi:hypothetical protein
MGWCEGGQRQTWPAILSPVHQNLAQKFFGPWNHGHPANGMADPALAGQGVGGSAHGPAVRLAPLGVIGQPLVHGQAMLLQAGGQGFSVAKAQVHALAGNGVQGLGGIADPDRVAFG